MILNSELNMIDINDISVKLETGKEKEFVAELKSYYDSKLQELKNQYRFSGFELSKKITNLVDEIFLTIYKEIYKKEIDEYEIAVIALGSYGRLELNPYSDIDIIFVYPNENQKNKDFISKILYILWDIKWTLGHSTRTFKNISEMASKDITFKTSLIDHRFLCGDESVYEDFEALTSKIFKKSRYPYYNDLIKKMGYFEKSMGENILLKEPQIKDSLGALRGIHFARWIGYNFFQKKYLSELCKELKYSDEEIERIESHLDYYLALRSTLHFLVGRKEDTLLLEHQESLVRYVLNIHKDDPFDDWKKKIEEFMREYYKRSKEVYSFLSFTIEALEVEANKYRQFSRIINRRKFLNTDFMIINKRLFFRKKLSDIEIEPQFIMEIFQQVSKYACYLSIEIESFLNNHINKIDDEFRLNRDGFEIFKLIITSERNLYHTLSIMNHVGFLPKYLPYFNELNCTTQHDYYHAYTVDEHTLQGVKELEMLYHQTEESGLDFFKSVLNSLNPEQKVILVFSILFHDIGKGRKGSHVVNGEVMMLYIVKAFPFSDKEQELLSFLVNEHLIMAHTSQRRDIQDLKVLYSFAQKVLSIDALKLLLLLTYTDMASVAPRVFTLWKGELLKELYDKTLKIIEGQSKRYLPVPIPDDLEKIKSKLLIEVSEEEKLDAGRILNLLDPSYIIQSDPKVILETIGIFKALKSKHLIKYKHEKDSYRITSYGLYQADAFCRIALLLANKGINIHKANIFPNESGYIITEFIVSSSFLTFEISEQRWNAIERKLDQYFEKNIDDIPLDFTNAKYKTNGEISKIPVNKKVTIDNELSDTFTVIELQCQDKIGLLFRISHLLLELGIIINSAFIATKGIQAIDTFYLSTDNHNKIVNENRLKELESKLLALV